MPIRIVFNDDNIRLLDENDHEIVMWDQAEWEEDPTVVYSIVNAVRIGMAEGGRYLRQTLSDAESLRAASGSGITGITSTDRRWRFYEANLGEDSVTIDPEEILSWPRSWFQEEAGRLLGMTQNAPPPPPSRAQQRNVLIACGGRLRSEFAGQGWLGMCDTILLEPPDVYALYVEFGTRNLTVRGLADRWRIDVGNDAEELLGYVTPAAPFSADYRPLFNQVKRLIERLNAGENVELEHDEPPPF